MKMMEVMGIEQSRNWGVCSLNEFRRYLGLKPYSSFLEWNSNPDVARTAESLYGDIERLELYVGLQAEEAKPLVDGAGLCPGYTVSRAILSDAIALTRGDRFFTHDFTPFNLTAWGFQDCMRDPTAFGYGSHLGKLFLRTLPKDFSDNSVYTFFPLMQPRAMKIHLKKLNALGEYDLARPTHQKPTTVVKDHPTVAAILKDQMAFRPPYSEKARKVVKGKGFYPAESIKEQDAVRKALSGSPEMVKKIGAFFYQNAQKALNEESYTFVGGKQRGIDVISKLVTALPIKWLVDLCGVRLRNKQDPTAPFNIAELSAALCDIYSFIFLQVEPSKVMVLQEKVRKHIEVLFPDIADNLTGTSIYGVMNFLFTYQKPTHFEIINTLWENDHLKDSTALTNALMAVMVVANAKLIMAGTNVIDLYVGSDKAEAVHKAAVAKDDAALKGFVYEGLRELPPFTGAFRVSTRQQIVNEREFKESERIFVDIVAANADAQGDTKKVLRAEGVFDYLGEELTVEILTRMLQAVFERKNLKRAPGFSGNIQRFKDETRPECHYSYLNHAQAPSEWPLSLSVTYDA